MTENTFQPYWVIITGGPHTSLKGRTARVIGIAGTAARVDCIYGLNPASSRLFPVSSLHKMSEEEIREVDEKR